MTERAAMLRRVVVKWSGVRQILIAESDRLECVNIICFLTCLDFLGKLLSRTLHSPVRDNNFPKKIRTLFVKLRTKVSRRHTHTHIRRICYGSLCREVPARLLGKVLTTSIRTRVWDVPHSPANRKARLLPHRIRFQNS